MRNQSIFLHAVVTCPACGRTEAEVFAEVGPEGLELVDCAACDSILPAAMVVGAGIQNGPFGCGNTLGARDRQPGGRHA